MLTNDGKQRMHNVGKWLREEYKEFLANTSIRDVYVRSSGKLRCLESAELLVNGAFKPNVNSIWAWNTSELWLPVPILTVEYNRDSVRFNLLIKQE